MATRKPTPKPAKAMEPATVDAAIEAGDREGALKLLAKSRLRNPDDAAGYTVAIDLLREMGRTDDAERLLAAARKRPAVAAALSRPGATAAAELEARANAALAAKRLAEAASLFAELRATYPGRGGGWLRGVEIARATGDTVAARALLDETLKLFAGNAGMMAARAYLLRDLGDHAASAETWAIVRSLDADLPDGWVHGCFATLAAGDAKGAEAIIAAGIARAPGTYALLAARAYLAEQIGDRSAARSHWLAARKVASDPAEGQCWSGEGWVRV